MDFSQYSFNMATKKGAENANDIVVIKKTRDVLIIQEGDVIKKYLFERECDVKQKKGKKEKEPMVEPKYVAQAAKLAKCEVQIERMKPCHIQKIIKDGEEKQKVRLQQQAIACK